MTWRSIADDPPPKDGTPFVAGVYVRHWNVARDGCRLGYRLEWEEHLVWCNDETGAIDDNCNQGWELEDYEYWCAVPRPLPPPPEDTP